MDKTPFFLSPQCQNYAKLGLKVRNANPHQKGIKDKSSTNEGKNRPSNPAGLRSGNVEGNDECLKTGSAVSHKGY